jgi:hypothetical protein
LHNGFTKGLIAAVVEDEVMDQARHLVRCVLPLYPLPSINHESSRRVPMAIENQQSIDSHWLYAVSKDVLERARECAIPHTSARVSFGIGD